MGLGENIVRLRTRRGLSQENLAEELGVSRQSVSKWETDGAVPDLDKLIKLSELFGVSLDNLVKGNNLPENGEPAVEPAGGAEASKQLKSGGSRRAGYVYLVIGAVITIILALLGGALPGLIFGLPFYICAAICLTSKEGRAGLWCGWALYFLVDLYLRYATGLTWQTIFLTLQWTPQMNYTRLFIAWCQFLVGLFFILWTAFSLEIKPWKTGENWRKPFAVGVVGLVCCTFLMITLNGIMAVNQFFTGPIYAAIFLGRTAMDDCRMLLVGWTAAQLVRFRREKGKKEKEMK